MSRDGDCALVMQVSGNSRGDYIDEEIAGERLARTPRNYQGNFRGGRRAVVVVPACVRLPTTGTADLGN